MANKKISDLIAAGAAVGTDLVEIETNAGASRKQTLTAIWSYFSSLLGTSSALNTDTDTALTANSDSVIATQKAVKAYVDANVGGGEPIAAPLASSLTWVNQGTASVADGTDALLITSDNDNEFHLLVKTAPSPPFDLYLKVDATIISSAASSAQIYAQPAIILRDSSDGEFLAVINASQRSAGGAQNMFYIELDRWTNPTTFSAGPLVRYQPVPYKWLRVNVTSTTVTIYVSADGKNWNQVGTETISTFVDAINQVGIGIRSDPNNTNTFIGVSYFSETAPF